MKLICFNQGFQQNFVSRHWCETNFVISWYKECILRNLVFCETVILAKRNKMKGNYVKWLLNETSQEEKTKLCSVCSSLWCLPTCMISGYWHHVFLFSSQPALCQLNYMMSAYLYDVFLPVWCLPTYWCLLKMVWSLPTCVMCSTGWYLPTCILFPTYMISALLYDVCLLVWSLPTCMMSAHLYDIFLLTCMRSAQLHEICLTPWWQYTCMMSALLYDVRLPVWCFPTFIMPGYLDYVFSTEWCLLTSRMSANFYICLLLWCGPLPSWKCGLNCLLSAYL
jgi:hypothetical protein